MTPSLHEDHWLDRLAVRHTRRQAFRAALAGTVLAVPFLRAVPSRADDATACRKGCLYTVHNQTVQSASSCYDITSGVTIGAGAVAGTFGLGFAFLALPSMTAKQLGDANTCRSLAILNGKSSSWDCLQSGCPGFDPKASGGPCSTCTASCCADQGVVNGYSCCNLCSSAGGCCYSVTGMC